MIAGIALYLKGVNPKIRIVGVQAESVAPLANIKRTDELKYVDPATFTIADGVNIKVRFAFLFHAKHCFACCSAKHETLSNVLVP